MRMSNLFSLEETSMTPHVHKIAQSLLGLFEGKLISAIYFLKNVIASLITSEGSLDKCNFNYTQQHDEVQGRANMKEGKPCTNIVNLCLCVYIPVQLGSMFPASHSQLDF